MATLPIVDRTAGGAVGRSSLQVLLRLVDRLSRGRSAPRGASCRGVLLIAAADLMRADRTDLPAARAGTRVFRLVVAAPRFDRSLLSEARSILRLAEAVDVDRLPAGVRQIVLSLERAPRGPGLPVELREAVLAVSWFLKAETGLDGREWWIAAQVRSVARDIVDEPSSARVARRAGFLSTAEMRRLFAAMAGVSPRRFLTISSGLGRPTRSPAAAPARGRRARHD